MDEKYSNFAAEGTSRNFPDRWHPLWIAGVSLGASTSPSAGGLLAPVLDLDLPGGARRTRGSQVVEEPQLLRSVFLYPLRDLLGFCY